MKRIVSLYSFYFLLLNIIYLISNFVWGDEIHKFRAYYMSAVLVVVVLLFEKFGKKKKITSN